MIALLLGCAEPSPPAFQVVSRAVLPHGAWDGLSSDATGACAWAADGRLACWRHDGRPVDGLPPRATAIAGGPAAGCGLDGGAVLCWGGLEAPVVDSPTAVAVTEGSACAVGAGGSVRCTGPLAASPPLTEVAELVAGAGTACAREPEATTCWGRRPVTFPFPRRGLAVARRGLCWVADGADLDCDVEFPGGLPAIDEVVGVSVADDHLCATRMGGRVHCVGRDRSSGLPPAEPLRDVAAAGGTTCGLRVADGSVTCWGRGYVAGVPSSGVLAMALSGDGGCAVVRGGDLACFGTSAETGQAAVPGPFRGVSVERGQACGLRSDRSAACWGNDAQRGRDALPERLAQVDAGLGVACGLTDGGEVVCAGAQAGALGPPPAGPWESVSAGALWVCAQGGGRVSCWGPKAGPPPDAGPWAAVSVGRDHACGLRADGRAACWGERWWRIPDLRFVQVAAGDEVNCGLDGDGAMACWGRVTGPPPDGRYVGLAVSTQQDAALGTLVCGRTADGHMDCAAL